MSCSICFNNIVDKVSMTCQATHSFCFKCLLENIRVNKQLKSCPLCMGGDKFILMSDNYDKESTDFYSINQLLKHKNIINRIMNEKDNSNSCLLSEKMLLVYILNKKQIEIYDKLISSGESIDDIYNYIKWSKQSEVVDFSTLFSSMLDYGFNSQPPPPTFYGSFSQGNDTSGTTGVRRETMDPFVYFSRRL